MREIQRKMGYMAKMTQTDRHLHVSHRIMQQAYSTYTISLNIFSIGKRAKEIRPATYMMVSHVTNTPRPHNIDRET